MIWNINSNLNVLQLGKNYPEYNHTDTHLFRELLLLFNLNWLVATTFFEIVIITVFNLSLDKTNKSISKCGIDQAIWIKRTCQNGNDGLVGNSGIRIILVNKYILCIILHIVCTKDITLVFSEESMKSSFKIEI